MKQKWLKICNDNDDDDVDINNHVIVVVIAGVLSSLSLSHFFCFIIIDTFTYIHIT